MSTAPKMSVTNGETDQPADSVPTAAESATPTHEEVAQLAYHYWEARGRPLGSPEETDHVFLNDNLVGSSMLVVAVTADILSALILWNGLKS